MVCQCLGGGKIKTVRKGGRAKQRGQKAKTIIGQQQRKDIERFTLGNIKITKQFRELPRTEREVQAPVKRTLFIDRTTVKSGLIITSKGMRVKVIKKPTTPKEVKVTDYFPIAKRETIRGLETIDFVGGKKAQRIRVLKESGLVKELEFLGRKTKTGQISQAGTLPIVRQAQRRLEKLQERQAQKISEKLQERQARKNVEELLAGKQISQLTTGQIRTSLLTSKKSGKKVKPFAWLKREAPPSRLTQIAKPKEVKPIRVSPRRKGEQVPRIESQLGIERPRAGFRPAIARRIEKAKQEIGATPFQAIAEAFGRKKRGFILLEPEAQAIPTINLPALLGKRGLQVPKRPTLPAFKEGVGDILKQPSIEALRPKTDVNLLPDLKVGRVPKTKELLSLGILGKVKPVSILGEKAGVGLLQSTASALALGQIPILASDLALGLRQEQFLEQAQKQELVQDFITIETIRDFPPPPRTRDPFPRKPPKPPKRPKPTPKKPRPLEPIIPPPTKPRKPPPPPKIKDPDKPRPFEKALGSTGRTVPSFNVMIREKGRFFKANTKALPRKKAFNFGADIVDNSAAATFKVVPTGRRTKERDVLQRNLINKFRQKGNLNIELNRNRIDSVGELQGITAKGLVASRRKAALRRVQGFITPKRKTRRRKKR